MARAGCYAPGGRARYPSTVLMCAVPARVAGVERVVLCVPPGPDGRVDDATLAAARIAGVDEVYRVGGAQAIAAMAYGTASVPAVDVIVGPGNRYVAEAKRQVSGVVGVASAFAGPSEIVVVAGPGTPAGAGRHRPGGAGRARTRRPGLAGDLVGGGGRRRVDGDVDRIVAALAPPGRPRGHPGLRRATPWWWTAPPRRWPSPTWWPPSTWSSWSTGPRRCSRWCTRPARCSWGSTSPASLGDYLAGPNHVLPTNRTARFASALRVDDFRRHLHAVSVRRDGVDALGPTSSRWPRPRASRPTPSPSGSAWPR